MGISQPKYLNSSWCFGAELIHVAAIAAARGCPRLDWSVLSWNQSAIDFYGRLGAEIMPDWRTCRLEGKALSQVSELADRL